MGNECWRRKPCFGLEKYGISALVLGAGYCGHAKLRPSELQARRGSDISENSSFRDDLPSAFEFGSV